MADEPSNGGGKTVGVAFAAVIAGVAKVCAGSGDDVARVGAGLVDDVGRAGVVGGAASEVVGDLGRAAPIDDAARAGGLWEYAGSAGAAAEAQVAPAVADDVARLSDEQVGEVAQIAAEVGGQALDAASGGDEGAAP